MATRQRTSGTVAGRVALGYPEYEDFEPRFEWREEPAANILSVFLPGFVKEQVRVTYNKLPRTVKVRGERPLGTNNFSRFSKDFSVPENCKPDEIRGKFDRGTLVLTLPKRTVTQVPPNEAPPEATAREKNLSEEPKTPKAGQQNVPSMTTSSYDIGKKKSDDVAGAKEADDQPKHQKSHEDAAPKATSSNASDPTPQNATRIKPQEAASYIRPDRAGYKADEGLGILAKEKGDRPTDESRTTKKPKFQQTPHDKGNKTSSQDEDKGQRTGEIEVLRKNNIEARLDDDKGKLISGPKAISDKEVIETENLVGAAKRTLKGLTTGLKEDRQLAVNMGVAIVAIVALGAYLSYNYKYGSSTRSEN